MKFKRLVPLALALAIASTTAAEAVRLPQNRFSFAVRPSYTQTVSRPSASKPLQSTAANSSYAAQVVSLVNAERARCSRRRRPAPENCKPAFRTHVRAAHPALPR